MRDEQPRGPRQPKAVPWALIRRATFPAFLLASLFPQAPPSALAGGPADMAASPIPSRNLSPIRLLFLVPRPEGAELPNQGELRTSLDSGYANYFERHVRGAEEIFLDLEILRLTLGARYGLTSRVAVGVDLAMQRVGSGFLDGVTDEVDALVGTVSSERERYGRDEYRFRWLSPSGEVILDPPRASLSLGDAALSIHYLLREDEGPTTLLPAVAVRGALEVPTGDRSTGAGSGGVDGSVGLAVSKPFLDRFSASLDLSLVIPSRPDFVKGIDVGPYVTFVPSVAARFLEGSIEALVQFDFEQTPFSGSRLLTLSKDSLDLLLGVRYAPDETLLMSVAFAEDLIADPSPDFQVWAGISYKLDLRPRRRLPSDWATFASASEGSGEADGRGRSSSRPTEGSEG